VNYVYKDAGLRTSITVTGQNMVFYKYDNTNWLTNVTRTKFTAREDDGTGLYYYRARYYHPALGRFVSEDPMDMIDGPNVYLYVGNDVIHRVDPLGLLGGQPACVSCQVSIDQFHYYGNYGGPGWSNGGLDPGSRLPPGQTGPPYGPPPIDDQDACYLVHDIAYKKCQPCKSDFNRTGCQRCADEALVRCLSHSRRGTNPGNLFNSRAATIVFHLTNRFSVRVGNESPYPCGSSE